MSDGGWPGSPDDMFSEEELAEARAVEGARSVGPKTEAVVVDLLKTKRERSIEQIEARLNFVPLETATTLDVSKERVIAKHWWIHRPGKGLVFYMPPGVRHEGDYTPQCNRDERITRKIAKKLYPDDEVIFVEAVYLRSQTP